MSSGQVRAREPFLAVWILHALDPSLPPASLGFFPFQTLLLKAFALHPLNSSPGKSLLTFPSTWHCIQRPVSDLVSCPWLPCTSSVWQKSLILNLPGYKLVSLLSIQATLFYFWLIRVTVHLILLLTDSSC